MSGSTLVYFIIVLAFWFLSAASKAAKNKKAQRGADQPPERGAPEPTVAPRQYPQGKTYRPVKPRYEGGTGWRERNAVDFDSIGRESLIKKKRDTVEAGSAEGYGWGGSISGMEREDYAVEGDSSTEGTSQWGYFSRQLAAPDQMAAQKEAQNMSPALDQLIPLHRNDLLKGVIFSEILSRKPARKW